MLHCLGDDCTGSRCWRYNSSFVGIPFASTNWIHMMRRSACHTRPWQVKMASQVLNLQSVSNFPATPQSFPSGAVTVIKIQGKLCFFQSHLEVHMASVITKPAIEYLPLQTWRQNPKLPPDLKAKSKGTGMRMTNVSPQKPWIFSLAIQSAIGHISILLCLVSSTASLRVIVTSWRLRLVKLYKAFQSILIDTHKAIKNCIRLNLIWKGYMIVK